MRRFHMRYHLVEETDLCLAVYHRNTASVKHLVECGVNVNQRSGRHGCTALKIAAASGLVDIVKILLMKGARVDMLLQTRHSSLLFKVAMSVQQNS